jgi:hypothetical protein
MAEHSIIGDAFIRIRPKTEGFKQEAKGGISGAMLGIAGAATGAGLALFELGKKSVEVAAGEAKSQAVLSVAFANTGQSISANSGLLEHARGFMERYGFTAGDTNMAMAKLETATKKPAKAMSDLGIAADLAAARQIPLATATQLVVKAQEGNAGALVKLGIVSADQAKKMKGHSEEILAALSKSYGGTAEKVAATAGGGFAALQATMENTLGKIGQVLLPPLQAILPIVTTLVGVIGTQLTTIFAAITPALQQIVPIIASLMTWIGTEVGDTLKVLMPIFAVLIKVGAALIEPILKLAEGLLKALMPSIMKLMNALLPSITKLALAFLPLVPLLVVIINLLLKLLLPALSLLTPIISGVVSVIATLVSGALDALISALTSVIGWLGSLGGSFSGIFKGIQKTVLAVWNFLWKDIFHPMYVFFKETIVAQLTIARDVFGAVFGAIKDTVLGAWNFIVGIWNGIGNFFTGVVNTIKRIAKDMWTPLYNAFVTVANLIIRAYDDTIGWIPGMHINALKPIGGGGSYGPNSAANAAAGAAGAAGAAQRQHRGLPPVVNSTVHVHVTQPLSNHDQIAAAVKPHLDAHTVKLSEAVKAAS